MVGVSWMEELLKRITIDPKVMADKPVIRGTRITVDDVRAALLYAAKVLGREETIIVEAKA